MYIVCFLPLSLHFFYWTLELLFYNNIVFLLFVLQFILIICDVETHPGPGTYDSNPLLPIIM
jgi:hypothetical protein